MNEKRYMMYIGHEWIKEKEQGGYAGFETLGSSTSWRASFSSASSGARMASIGGMSSSFCAAWTLRSVASAANCAASAAFFSSLIFFASRFWNLAYYQNLFLHKKKKKQGNEQEEKGKSSSITLLSRRDSVSFSFSSTFANSSVSLHWCRRQSQNCLLRNKINGCDCSLVRLEMIIMIYNQEFRSQAKSVKRFDFVPTPAM
jgi:hypothetical protein